jgi:hypothetical protein
MLHRVHLTMNGVGTRNLVVMGTDHTGTGSCNSNYHTTTTTPFRFLNGTHFKSLPRNRICDINLAFLYNVYVFIGNGRWSPLQKILMRALRENWCVFFLETWLNSKLYMNIEIIRSSSTNFNFFVSIGYPRWPLSDKLKILLNIFLCIYLLLIHISNDILHRVTSLLIFSTDQSKTHWEEEGDDVFRR